MSQYETGIQPSIATARDAITREWIATISWLKMRAEVRRTWIRRDGVEAWRMRERGFPKEGARDRCCRSFLALVVDMQTWDSGCPNLQELKRALRCPS